MELPVSNKVANYGKRTKIKKGYYPGKLLEVKERIDKDNKPHEGKYGRSLILTFAVYKPVEKGLPTSPIQVPVFDEQGKETNSLQDLQLDKFVYHTYKDPKTNEYRTAVTPNSAITKIFKALGWEFNAEKPLKTDEFVGKWAELNVDDYEVEATDLNEAYKASTIKDIAPFEFEPCELKEAKKAETKNTAQTTPKPQVLEVRKKMDTMKELLAKGHVTEEGYEQAMEQLDKEMELAETK